MKRIYSSLQPVANPKQVSEQQNKSSFTIGEVIDFKSTEFQYLMNQIALKRDDKLRDERLKGKV